MTASRTQRFRASLLRPWFLVLTACLIYSLAIIALNDGDPLTLVTIGTQFSEGLDVRQGGTEGYDGQFVYYIARDPSTAERYLDAPAYRFQRILLPILGRWLALGHIALIPWTLLVINLMALAAGTALLEYLLRQYGASRWYALGYGFALGTFGAVRLSLPEPLAYALALGAVVLARQERWLYAAAALALAALAKETALIFTAGLALYLLSGRQWRTFVVFLSVAVLPFIMWQMILRWRLGEFGVGSGGAGATSFEIIPFGGFLKILTGAESLIAFEFHRIPYGDLLLIPTRTVFSPGILIVFGVFLLLLTPFALFPTVWALRQCWRLRKSLLRGDQANMATFVLLTNAGIMLFVPFSTYREPLGILRFVVGLQVAVILYAAQQRSGRALLNSTIWGYTIILLIAWDLAPAS